MIIKRSILSLIAVALTLGVTFLLAGPGTTVERPTATPLTATPRVTVGPQATVEQPTATPLTVTPRGAVGPQATPTPSVTYLPLIARNFYSSAEWAQFAANPEHTSYVPTEVPSPWRLKWIWNGPDNSGGVGAGKFSLPRNSQPVTGAGRVYIAAGGQGVYALNSATGAVVWSRNPGGVINSTPAYDGDTAALFVVSSNGVLYKLDAATGSTLGQFSAGSSSALPLPPAVISDRVFFSMGNRVYAVNKSTLTQIWAYNAGAPVHTPPAYSRSRDRVIAVSQDLYVHAINNSDGSRAWRIKPTVRTGGDPDDSNSTLAEVSDGWPVIAESHGYVLVKLRLDWQALWIWTPWPGSNAAVRSNLQAEPEYQALLVLDLDDGATPFAANVGHGGFGDGGHLPMGPQPVIKRFSNGQEVAYVVMRGSPCAQSPCDGRWDSHLGEMVLDGNTVPGYQAGDVRFMQNSFFPTDEQVNLSMAGNDIFGGHWMFGIAHQILDRSSSKGTGSNPITTSNLPHIITSASNCGYSASHYCPNALVQDGDPRTLPEGFYIYYNAGQVYDQYWSEYAAWVVSNDTVYFVSDDGAVVALETGNPTAAGPSAPALADADPRVDASRTGFTQSNGPPEPPNFAADVSLSPGLVSGSAEAVIPYTQARQYAGQTKMVEGTLKQVFNNRLAVYLGFQNPHQGAFTVRIMKEAWVSFEASPETLYEVGQRVRVTGTITWYQGDPVIYVHDPSQVEIMERPDPFFIQGMSHAPGNKR